MTEPVNNRSTVQSRPTAFQRVPLLGLVAISALLALNAVACGGGDGDGSALDTRTVALNEVNDSGYTGEVLLTSAGNNRTVVVVALGTGDGPQGDFPVAIQEGACSGLSGNIVYEIEDSRSGFTVQELSTTLETLDEKDHALVVFESNARSVYVACADIP